MAFSLNQKTAGDVDVPKGNAAGSGFQVTNEPLVSPPSRSAAGVDLHETELPRSYGSQSLFLLPRDPKSLFVFWDIDWGAAFGDQTPTERKVHLRIFKADGSEETAREVEPMAGSCYVAVSVSDEPYSGDIGFYDAAGAWNSLASSASARMPTSGLSESEDVDFATVPFHLSFQRMIDAFRGSHRENGSLTDLLSDLRARASSGDAATLTAGERDLVRVLDSAIAGSEQLPSATSHPRDLWAQLDLERVFGFGATSPSEAFGGSSRAL